MTSIFASFLIDVSCELNPSSQRESMFVDVVSVVFFVMISLFSGGISEHSLSPQTFDEPTYVNEFPFDFAASAV
ncbi:MAG: hypothetical protein ACRBB5_04100 [Nitrosopumilus sp.]